MSRDMRKPTPDHDRTPPPSEHAQAYRPSRRTFLIAAARVTGCVVAAATLPVLARRAMAAPDTTATRAAFLALSAFVTGRTDLDAVTGERFHAALARRLPGFDTQVATLLAQVRTQRFADMDAFLAATPAPSPLRATATHVVSAWYLGIVGEAADAELITYAGALMYRPTRGILAVPTYGPGPLAWGPKPSAS